MPVPLPPSSAKKFAFVQLQGQAFHDIGQVFVVLEPEFLRRDNGFRVRCVFCFFWESAAIHVLLHNRAASSGRRRRRWGRPLWNPSPPRCAWRRAWRETSRCHWLFSSAPTSAGVPVQRSLPLSMTATRDAKRERFFQAMLGQNDRRAKLPVDSCRGWQESQTRRSGRAGSSARPESKLSAAAP